MSTIAILGGGVSGLSCAYYLKTLGKTKIKYLFLLEKSPKFGGWIQTTRFPDGAIFEHGPHTLRVAGKSGYNALELVERLDLSSQVIPIDRNHPGAQKRYVLFENKLHILPNKLKYLFRAVPPFRESLFGSLRRDLTTPKGELEDESVYDFGQRRFSKDVADFIFDPMCRGICASDAKDTSMRSLMPLLYQFEKEFGSVTKGMILSTKKGSDVSNYLQNHLVHMARQNFWRMWSLKNGLAELIDTLALAVDERGVSDIHVNAECTGLQFNNGKAQLMVDGEQIEVDHVFSSIPAANLAQLLPSYNELAQRLTSIQSVSVAVVNLEFDRFVLKEEGFGFLTPSFEDSKVLGIIFDSCCFPEHNGSCRTRITCMMGGKWFKDIFGDIETVRKDAVLSTAVDAAKRHLGITDTPARFHVAIQKNCIPQYVVGHHKKLDSIKAEIERHNLCLSVIGASYQAAGVPDCIYNTRLCVENFLKNLA